MNSHLNFNIDRNESEFKSEYIINEATQYILQHAILKYSVHCYPALAMKDEFDCELPIWMKLHKTFAYSSFI